MIPTTATRSFICVLTRYAATCAVGLSILSWGGEASGLPRSSVSHGSTSSVPPNETPAPAPSPTDTAAPKTNTSSASVSSSSSAQSCITDEALQQQVSALLEEANLDADANRDTTNDTQSSSDGSEPTGLRYTLTSIMSLPGGDSYEVTDEQCLPQLSCESAPSNPGAETTPASIGSSSSQSNGQMLSQLAQAAPTEGDANGSDEEEPSEGDDEVELTKEDDPNGYDEVELTAEDDPDGEDEVELTEEDNPDGEDEEEEEEEEDGRPDGDKNKFNDWLGRKPCCVFVYSRPGSGSGTYAVGDSWENNSRVFKWPEECKGRVINCALNANTHPWRLVDCFLRHSGRRLGDGKQAMEALNCGVTNVLTLHHANPDHGARMCRGVQRCISKAERIGVNVVQMGCSTFGNPPERCATANRLATLFQKRCDKLGAKDFYVMIGNTIPNWIPVAGSAPSCSWEVPDGSARGTNVDHMRKIKITKDGFVICKIVNKTWVPDTNYCPTRHPLDRTGDPNLPRDLQCS